MIYFDNAATGGFKPDSVISAVCAALQSPANPGRSGHSLSISCLERVYAVRRLLSDFFGGDSYDRVIFTKNCTEALNIALLGVLKSGDEAVTTVAEHNSVLRPLRALEKRGVKVKYAPLEEGEISTRNILSLVTPSTRAVIVTLASNVTGAAPDIRAVKDGLPKDTLLICDGAQACGHVPVNMTEYGIDALAVAGHKGMLGIQGSGALLFSSRVNPEPIAYGGTGSESFSADMPEFYPDKLESGTLSYPAIISLGEGVLYLNENMQRDGEALMSLTNCLVTSLASCAGVKVYSRPNPYGIVAFSLENMQSEIAAYRLSEEYSICVRGGLHCAPMMHESLSSDGLIRASLCAKNTREECEKLLLAVRALARG